MPSPESLAAQLARCVELFRDAGAKEAQKAEFRTLLGLLRQEGLSLRDDGVRLLVNGAPVDGSALGSLVHRLALHNIGEITVPHAPLPTEVFALVTALAEQPGADDIPTRLRASGVTRVSVAVGPVTPPDAPGASPSAPPPPPSPRSRLGTEGILRGDPMTDIASPEQRVPGVPLVTYDPPPPPEETSLPATGSAPPSDALPAPASPAPPGPPAPPAPARPSAGPPPAAAAPAPAPPSAPPPPPVAPAPPAAPPPKRGASTAAAAPAGAPTDPLQELARNPQGPNVGDVLAVLGRQLENAMSANRFEQALAIAAAIVKQEARVTDASARRNYGIALRRMYTKALLKGFIHLMAAPAHRAEAIVALRRGGAEAVELLLDRLIAARDMGERRAAFDALRQMKEGTDQLVQKLDHKDWFVVRNVAELIGELGMEEAVPALSRLLDHREERVRKAAALALAKLGSGSAAEALRRALRDKSPEVRMQVALGVGGRRSNALAMPLVVAIDGEKDEAVQRELVLALGRIGTPDAVQALIKVAQPTGRLFGRKPVALRVAAVEALRLAATAPAVGTLEGLQGDAERQVGAAAREALLELKKRKSDPRGRAPG